MTSRIGLVLLAGALAGCATLPGNPADMTAEQLREMIRDKSASVGCATVGTPYRGNVVYLNLDKGVLNFGGTISVDSECKVTIVSDPKSPAE